MHVRWHQIDSYYLLFLYSLVYAVKNYKLAALCFSSTTILSYYKENFSVILVCKVKPDTFVGFCAQHYYDIKCCNRQVKTCYSDCTVAVNIILNAENVALC